MRTNAFFSFRAASHFSKIFADNGVRLSPPPSHFKGQSEFNDACPNFDHKTPFFLCVYFSRAGGGSWVAGWKKGGGIEAIYHDRPAAKKLGLLHMCPSSEEVKKFNWFRDGKNFLISEWWASWREEGRESRRSVGRFWLSHSVFPKRDE